MRLPASAERRAAGDAGDVRPHRCPRADMIRRLQRGAAAAITVIAAAVLIIFVGLPLLADLPARAAVDAARPAALARSRATRCASASRPASSPSPSSSSSARRWRICWGRGSFPGRNVDHDLPRAPAGAAAGRRRHRALRRLRPHGPARRRSSTPSASDSRSPGSPSCMAQAFVAMPFYVRQAIAGVRLGRPAVRRRLADARRRADALVLPHRGPAGRQEPLRRRDPRVGARARRVRRHRAVRRQPARASPRPCRWPSTPSSRPPTSTRRWPCRRCWSR